MRSLFWSSNHSLSVRVLVLSAVALVACFSNSCNHESNPVQPPETPPSELRNATFPLALGNQWAYADSVLSEPISATLLTNTISGYSSGWWNVEISLGGSFSLSSRNDTILFLSPGAPQPWIQYIPNPPLGDTVLIWRGYSQSELLPVRVYSLGQPVITPAGTFDSCAVYESYTAPHLNRLVTYFRPRIGVISWEIYSLQDTLQVIQRTKLVFLRLSK